MAVAPVPAAERGGQGGRRGQAEQARAGWAVQTVTQW